MTTPKFRMFGASYTGFATLGFLACVLALMAFDKPVGIWTVASISIIAPMLVGGWHLCRDRIREVAEGE